MSSLRTPSPEQSCPPQVFAGPRVPLALERVLSETRLLCLWSGTRVPGYSTYRVHIITYNFKHDIKKYCTVFEMTRFLNENVWRDVPTCGQHDSIITAAVNTTFHHHASPLSSQRRRRTTLRHGSCFLPPQTLPTCLWLRANSLRSRRDNSRP